MISARSRFLAPAAAVLSLGLLAACSSDDSSDSSGAVGTALEGVEVTVGSKDFTENILLGQMLAQAMEAEGASVTDQTNLGGTSVNRAALEDGQIDVYPDYNGTGWTVHLGLQDPSSDGEELFTQVAERDLSDNGIMWSGKSSFNNTYGFATGSALAEANGGGFDLQGMADYLEANPDATVCLETEFPDRPDGLVLFEEATGYELPRSQTQILDTGLIYTQTADGTCDFGEVYTTDGRIPALDMALVDDPGVFIVYNLSFTWDDEKFQEHAETYQRLADEILAPLTQEKMSALNAQVDVDGEDYEDVASEYLQEIGLK